MVWVWTERFRKKFRTAEEEEFDAKKNQKKIDAKPGQYYLYIPKSIMVIPLGIPSMLVVFVLARRLIFQLLIPRK